MKLHVFVLRKKSGRTHTPCSTFLWRMGFRVVGAEGSDVFGFLGHDLNTYVFCDKKEAERWWDMEG